MTVIGGVMVVMGLVIVPFLWMGRWYRHSEPLVYWGLAMLSLTLVSLGLKIVSLFA